MNFADAVTALDARTNYETSGRMVAPTLDRMRALCDMLANPERLYPTIHITGTNGKSTCARAATEVLRASGLSVATYTSPHVSTIRERFLYDGEQISQDDFVEVWRELAPYLEHFDDIGQRITWFEAATALAFVWFADKAVDVAVIEVGMGGSWDATNVIDAPIAVITPIAIDHAHVLGVSPEIIAEEKAGVIKSGSIVISGEQLPAVNNVLRARCESMGAELRMEGDMFELERAALAVSGQAISMRIGSDRYEQLFLPMFGEHFAHDALLGTVAARAMLGDVPLDEALLEQGLARVTVPGRMEIARRAPMFVLDGAHNPAAASALADGLSASFVWTKLWLVVSIMGDKDIAGVLSPLVGMADEVIVTRNVSPRAASLEQVAAGVRALGKEPVCIANVSDAISVAMERAEETDCVCVTGSLYTVGEARERLIRPRSTFPKETL